MFQQKHTVEQVDGLAQEAPPPADPFRRDLFSDAHRIAVSYDVNSPTAPKSLDTEIKLLETAVKSDGEKDALTALRLVRDNQDAMAFLEAIRNTSAKIGDNYQSSVEELNAVDAPAFIKQSVEKLILAMDWQREIRDQMQSGNVCFYAPRHPEGAFDFRERVQKLGLPVINGQYSMFVAYAPCMKFLRAANDSLTKSVGELINNNGKLPQK